MKFNVKKLCAPAFLLLGAAGIGLREWIYRSAVDSRELLIPGSLPEILLWVLTACVIGGALFAAKGSTVKPDGQLLPGIGAVVLVGGLYTLLGIPAAERDRLAAVYSPLIIVTMIALLASAMQKLRGKKPLFLPELVVSLFFIVHLFRCYQLWSERPALLGYFFGLGAVLSLLLHSFYRMARACGLKLKFTSCAVSLIGIFFCAVAGRQGDFDWFFLSSAVWMALEMTELGDAAPEAEPVPEPAPEGAEA